MKFHSDHAVTKIHIKLNYQSKTFGLFHRCEITHSKFSIAILYSPSTPHCSMSITLFSIAAQSEQADSISGQTSCTSTHASCVGQLTEGIVARLHPDRHSGSMQ